jgi:transposase-like protein
VDGHPAYAVAIAELKQAGDLGRAPYLNNIIEQDHRFIKKRITASLGFRWVAKGDPVAQRQFIHTIFGIAA